MHLKLRRNAAWALIEVIFSGLTLFFLYKVIVKELGMEALGIWSLVLATTSLGRLADIGTAAGLSRFVALARAKHEEEKTLGYVETAFLTNLGLYAVIVLIMWAPAYWGLKLATDGEKLTEARALLPYALISFICAGLASATTGAVVGQQRSDQKSQITIMSLAVMFATAKLFVPRFGLRGLAWAQIAQYLFSIAVGWALFLKNHYGAWTLRIPLHWKGATFRELLSFGLKMQAASIASFIYEPITKFLMSSLGGLVALGFFEMAQRLVQQTRQLMVMPTSVLVPGFAHLSEQEPERVTPLYHQAMAVVIALGLPLMTAVAAVSPFICYLWIGRVESLFIFFTITMSAGWAATLVAAPAYLLGVARGLIKWNFYGHALTACGALLLGFVLGRLYGGLGVAASTSFMLAAGSLLSMIMNCRTLHISPLPTTADFRAVAQKAMILTKRI